MSRSYLTFNPDLEGASFLHAHEAGPRMGVDAASSKVAPFVLGARTAGTAEAVHTGTGGSAGSGVKVAPGSSEATAGSNSAASNVDGHIAPGSTEGNVPPVVQTVSPEADNAIATDADEDLPLQYQWHVWEQLEADSQQREYTENMLPISAFSSVQDFWLLWRLLPQPSQLMSDKRMVRETGDGQRQMVDAIMIFRDGVKPMWEDPLNQNGGHFEIRYQQSSDEEDLARLDEHWNNIVLSMIGATIQPQGMITGVRLVDKLHSTGRGGFIRIEIWFTEENFPNTRQELRENVERAITTKLDGTRDTTRLTMVLKNHQQKSK